MNMKMNELARVGFVVSRQPEIPSLAIRRSGRRPTRWTGCLCPP